MTAEDSSWADRLTHAEPSVRATVAADLHSYIRRVLHKGFADRLSEADREDLSQESMLRIHQRLDSFRGDSRFTTWAAAIAVNCALSELRRRKYQHISLEDAMRDAAENLALESTGAELVERERDAALRDAIRDVLTERQRRALLAELSGMPIVEIARRLGSDRNSVYKLLHDARKRLRAHLRDPDRLPTKMGTHTERGRS